MATNSHLQQRGDRARIILRGAVLTIAIAAGAYAAGASTEAPSAAPSKTTVVRIAARGAVQRVVSRPYTYGWPVKPFNRQHPIRGYFGDPRSVYESNPTVAGLMHGRCQCSYHFGVDISAPDGTAVYPVTSGTVRAISSHWVWVDSGGGRSFQYWHITPTVLQGDRVEANTTVLGHIQKSLKHVHFTQLENDAPVNPLAAGNLGPYVDTTIPRVNRIEFRATETGRRLLPEYLHGRVQIVADAVDTPAMPVPGMWANLPVSPARISYRIETVPERGVVIPNTTVVDVTRGIPPVRQMWRTYARGTRMNMVKMGSHRYWYNPGVYLFKVGERFDTTRLHDGVYALVVSAADASGNQSSTTQVINVHNRADWLG